ncbi:MAG: adenylate/guanylate cyclase domain-containing protein [Rhodospirillaceae bacterium]|nr:adenylate/guanylate cyclase domain-containing protein [Rhodospirillaceae bacterium]MBT5676478.1 adenylate/guanylate cyclase domain-containing protein [Rhodospirillaceae bacterium]
MTSRFQGRVSITITLATAIGLLVFITAGSVLGVGVWLAQKNTFSLLSANADQAIGAAVRQIEQHLEPAEHQARFIARRIERGYMDPGDREKFGPLLIGALAAAPQVEAIMLIDQDLQSFAAGRDREKDLVSTNEIDFSNDPKVRASMSNISHGAGWGAPIWNDQYKKTYLNLAAPVMRDGELMGAVVAVVSVEQLSSFVDTVGSDHAGQRFILYGRDHVIAHSRLIDGYPQGSSEAPLPSVSDFSDAVLAAIWSDEGRYELEQMEMPESTDGHVIQIDDAEYVFVYREVAGFGPLPLTVGAYFKASDVGEEVRRMMIALIAGVAALLLSLVAAIFVGRRIARPIVRFSAAAGRIRDLDISQVEELPGSVFRELNEQSNSFNAMLGALRWFELYVPRKVVESLIKRGSADESLSDGREITVLFTDIVGFSSASENLRAAEVAAFVNAHLSIVVDCIEAEGGTVDKFIGDSVMAFWGAPEEQADAPERACRAALAIAEKIHHDNKRKQALGEAPTHIRIGIHSGSATVGNIGAPGRLNYTIIGDTVNIGQRLEQLGKEIHPDGTEISILISGDTAGKLGPGFAPASVGRHKVKGRVGEIEVFELRREEGS